MRSMGDGSGLIRTVPDLQVRHRVDSVHPGTGVKRRGICVISISARQSTIRYFAGPIVSMTKEPSLHFH